LQLTHTEKKNKEQEERRRKEAEDRNQKHDGKIVQDRLQKMTEIVKFKVQSRPPSKVQCIDPLPLPASEMKKISHRRVSEGRRSSTDSEGTSSSREKNVERSLEKVSPLGTLYGEMPQPPKTAVFRIPKKVRARRSPTPPRRKRSPTPPTSTSADFEDDDEPPLRYDSSEEETEKPVASKVESKMEKKVGRTESPVIDEEENKKTAKNSEEESSLSAQKVTEMVKAALLSMGIKPVEKADSRPESRNDEEKALMNPNDIAAMVKSFVQNELSRHISPSKNEQEVSSTNEAENDLSKPKSKELHQKNKEAVPSDVKTSEDDSKMPKPSTSKSSLEDKVLQAVEQEVRKQKGHKKTELDKLQEDIRESFIKDGVMKAVGARTRNPVTRYDLQGERNKKTAETSKAAKEKSSDEPDSDSEAAPITTKNLVVRLERLKRVAKRGKKFG